jgi:hypothetical protein
MFIGQYGNVFMPMKNVACLGFATFEGEPEFSSDVWVI